MLVDTKSKNPIKETVVKYENGDITTLTERYAIFKKIGESGMQVEMSHTSKNDVFDMLIYIMELSARMGLIPTGALMAMIKYFEEEEGM